MVATMSEGTDQIDAAVNAGIRFVQLQFTDIIGHVKAVTIPIHQLEGSVKHGTWFDGSSIEGFTRIAESDQYLMPDMATFAEIPWQKGSGPRGTARVICDVFTPRGEPFVGDPRFVLRRQVERAKKLGYIVNTGPELEFFLFRRDEDGAIAPLPHDQAGYFDFSTDLAQEVRQDMVDALEAFGIRVEAAHHEVAAGQHEIDFEYCDALSTADNAITFKFALKAIAQQHGLYATFMPKPIHGINGSGMHTHQSLYSIAEDRNAFADASNPYGLSDVARSYMAGILAHARGMSAVLAPLVNSYKRLVPGYEAPTYLTWGRTNRSALIRVPMVSPGKSIEGTRAEVRCPDPSSNTYLAFAVMIAAGLDGVEKGLQLARPGRGEPVRDGRGDDRREGDQGAAGHARRGDRRARGRPRRPRGPRRPRPEPLRRGEARRVGRVPDPGLRLGGRALPRPVLGRIRAGPGTEHRSGHGSGLRARSGFEVEGPTVRPGSCRPARVRLSARADRGGGPVAAVWLCAARRCSLEYRRDAVSSAARIIDASLRRVPRLARRSSGSRDDHPPSRTSGVPYSARTPRKSVRSAVPNNGARYGEPQPAPRRCPTRD